MKLPRQPEDISPQWLTSVLGSSVLSSTIVDAHSGTTGRAVLEVTYAGDSSLPERFFVKLPPTDELQRAFVCSSGMGRREAMFYRQLSGEVPLRVPRCYHADSDESGENYIMLLEHLEDSGCQFQNASSRYSLAYIRSVLDSFSALHAQYWLSPRFDTDLDWVQSPLQHEIAVALIESALNQFADEMPVVFTAMARLYLDRADDIHRLWNIGSHTLIHGDVHDANLFTDGDLPGFLDWALVARGPAMRDVGYFLAGTMSPEDRRQHEKGMLSYYRQRLVTAGVTAPDEEELWQQYRWHAAYLWVGATVTLAMGDAWQPVNYTRKALERLNLVLEDLGTVEALAASA